jgi:acyl carrier protein
MKSLEPAVSEPALSSAAVIAAISRAFDLQGTLDSQVPLMESQLAIDSLGFVRFTSALEELTGRRIPENLAYSFLGKNATTITEDLRRFLAGAAIETK